MRLFQPGRLLVLTALLGLAAGCGIQPVQPSTIPGTSVPVSPTAIPSATPVPVHFSGGNVAVIINNQPVSMALFKRLFTAFNNLALARSATGQAAPPTPASVSQEVLKQLELSYELSQFATAHGYTISAKRLNKLVRTSLTPTVKSYGFTPALVKLVVQQPLLEQTIANHLYPLIKTGSIAMARHILIAPGGTTKNPCAGKILTVPQAKQLAHKLLHEIQRGQKTFAAVAKKCSTDTTSGALGGVMQSSTGTNRQLLYHTGQFVPVFENAVFLGPVHTIHIIHSRFGYHIIQVTKRYVGRYPKTEAQLAQEVKMTPWLSSLPKRSHVVVKVKVS